MNEGEPRGEKKPSVLEEEDIKSFIERRKIRPEDFHLIETLAQFPSDLVTEELHNMFVDREKSSERIKKRMSSLEEGKFQYAKRKALLEAILQLIEKYDWATCNHLADVLERRCVPWRLEDFKN